MKKSLEAGSDGLEIDVQLTKDNVVVLYHPSDLSDKTNGNGKVASLDYDQVIKLDAAYNFDPFGYKAFSERGKNHKIPSLLEVLDKFPNEEIIVDLKSLPAKPLIDAIIKVVDAKDAWGRLIFYSTNDEHLEYFRNTKPEAILFESRNITRKRLLSLRNERICCCSNHDSLYIGFELDREMLVEENLTLGNDKSIVHFRLWDEEAMKCIKQMKGQNVKVFLFGVNNKDDYMKAKDLGVYAIFSDNVLQF